MNDYSKIPSVGERCIMTDGLGLKRFCIALHRHEYWYKCVETQEGVALLAAA